MSHSVSVNCQLTIRSVLYQMFSLYFLLTAIAVHFLLHRQILCVNFKNTRHARVFCLLIAQPKMNWRKPKFMRDPSLYCDIVMCNVILSRCTRLCQPGYWSGKREKKLRDFCSDIICNIHKTLLSDNILCLVGTRAEVKA